MRFLPPKTHTTHTRKPQRKRWGFLVFLLQTSCAKIGAAAAPSLLKWFGITEKLSQGLAIGTSSHAAGTSRAVEMGEVQGAASSLAIVVTGLLTVIAAPIFAQLV